LINAKEAGFPDAKVSGKPVAELTKASVKNAPEDVMILGCNPDYSAYERGMKAPELANGDKRRYTGGHLHFNFVDESANDWWRDSNAKDIDVRKLDEEERVEHGAAAAVIYDYIIGLPSVAVLGKLHADGEAERRLKYGQAGSYRIPAHGVEYRVLSGNGAMLHPVLLTLWLGMGRRFNNRSTTTFKRAIANLKRNIPVDVVRSTIDNHDFVTAWDLILEEHWQNAVSQMAEYIRPTEQERKLVRILAQAAKDKVSWGDDIGENWGATHYPDYRAQSHGYWGIGGAMGGRLSEMIFPQRPYIKTTNKIQVFHPSEKKQPLKERTW
jgi:hypothetical protein